LAVARRKLAAARAERPRGRVRELAEILLVAVERVAGDEEPDRLALGAELLLRRPRRRRRERRRLLVRIAGAEGRALRRRALLRPARRPAHDVVEAREEPRAVPLERVVRAALEEALDDPAVHELAPDAEAEVVEGREGALLARRDDRLDRLRADTLHGAEP